MKRKVAGCGRGDKMTDRITRRDALKLGTSAAVSATVSPLIRSITDHVSSVNRASSTLPDSESTVMPPTTEDEICFMRARDLAGTIRDKKISAREVMQAHLKQIARVNPKVNAIVTLVPEEQLMAQALAADEAIAKGHLLGPLHGLPVGVKDLHLTKGIRTTHGSLRNPPNFGNVVGIRPSPGRVPNPPTTLGWFTLSVDGPVARNVVDCAFFMSVLAGFDRRSPISIDESGSQFANPLGRDFHGVRVAMFKDLGLPWELPVRDAVKAQRKVLESLGCIVEEAEPDFTDANESFLLWRHWSIELSFGDILEANADKLNQYVHWHVHEGRKLTGPQLARMEAKRTELYQRTRQFMEKYEFFVLPVNQVLPFDVKTHYPTEIAGVKMETYMAWMKSAYYISAVGNPAMSVPCAFSESGLPIAMQIVGRHHDDWGVLQLGHAFEQATGIGKRRPPIL